MGALVAGVDNIILASNDNLGHYVTLAAIVVRHQEVDRCNEHGTLIYLFITVHNYMKHTF